MTPARFLMVTIILVYICDSQLNGPESVSLASLARSPIIGERAKRARHFQVCSIENRGYIYYILYIVRANFVLITRTEGVA